MIQHRVNATERDAIEHATQSSHYKMLRMVGSFRCQDQWSSDLDRACYRATQRFRVNLTTAEMDVIGELYSRITRDRDQEEIQDVLATWCDIQSYREHHLWVMWLDADYVLSREQVDAVRLD